jgi:hypothetical protein
LKGSVPDLIGSVAHTSLLERDTKFLARGNKTSPAVKAHKDAEKLKAKAEALEIHARLEDLTARVAEKVKMTKTGMPEFKAKKYHLMQEAPPYFK